MQITLAEIAKIVEGELVGDAQIKITGLSGIEDAHEGDITFVSNSKYIPLIKKTKASAIITNRDISISEKSVILTDNSSLAFTKLIAHIAGEPKHPVKGIHPTAIIAKDTLIGKNVAVGPYTIIESSVNIGDGTVIYGGSYIGVYAKIGKDCLIYPHVTIRENIEIGNNVIIHSGTVIGSDGFGFEQVDGMHAKIPQIGTVVVEDDVEIGANVAIDRARFEKTIIGKGTKIDNLVQIAHNVKIGEKCIIVSQVGISGSVIVEREAILAGQAGVAGHLTIGEGAIVAAQAGVTKSVRPHTKVSDYPAKPHEEAKKVNASLQRLPHYVKVIRDLKRRIEELEEKINGGQ